MRSSSFPSFSLPRRPRQPEGTDYDLVLATPIRTGLLLLPFSRLPREPRSTDFHLRDIFSLSLLFRHRCSVAPSTWRASLPLPRERTSSDSFFVRGQPEFLSPSLRSSSSLDLSHQVISLRRFFLQSFHKRIA